LVRSGVVGADVVGVVPVPDEVGPREDAVRPIALLPLQAGAFFDTIGQKLTSEAPCRMELVAHRLVHVFGLI
jgi:hypothetical protein